MKPYGQKQKVTCMCCARNGEITQSRYGGHNRVNVKASRRPAKKRARAASKAMCLHLDGE